MNSSLRIPALALFTVTLLPALAAAAPAAFTLNDLEADLPACVEIAEQEEAALLFSNHCDQTFTVTPIAEACVGCDPAITLAPGEMGWYGLAQNGDGHSAAGTRAATWVQSSGRSGTLSAKVGVAAAELATGGCQIHPAAPAGGAFFGLAFMMGGLLRLRRRRG